jgi:hypothetical protein
LQTNATVRSLGRGSFGSDTPIGVRKGWPVAPPTTREPIFARDVLSDFPHARSVPFDFRPTACEIGFPCKNRALSRVVDEKNRLNF